MSARRGRASEGNVERDGVPKNVKEVPKSLWVCGFIEQWKVELTSGKSPGEKSVHLPCRSRLGLKLNLIYRKQRNVIVVALPEFATGVRIHDST